VLLYPRSRVHAGDVAAVETFKKLGQRLLDGHVLFDVRPDDKVAATDLASYKHVVKLGGAEDFLNKSGNELSRFDGPRTVRVSMQRPKDGEELDLHLVNYNRQEPAERRSAGRGIVDEKPIAVDGFTADLVLPRGFQPTKLWFLTPESDQVSE